MKQLIVWNNDTDKTMSVYEQTLEASSSLGLVHPHSMKVFEIEAPREDQDLYIKQWPNGVVLIGGIDSSTTDLIQDPDYNDLEQVEHDTSY